MQDRRQWIPFGGLFVTIAVAVYFVIRLEAQVPVPTGDFTSAAMAQVRDSQGYVVLEGPFMGPVEEDGNLERRARLVPAGADTDAAGEAEVEFAKTGPVQQEVEFSVTNLQPAATFTFVIDGTDIAVATTDRRGRAEIELDVHIAGKTASR
jgi:hypothetical protein